MPSVFGGFLLDLLASRGLKQSDLAEIVGMSQGNISRIIAGSPRAPGPPLGRLTEWADALKLEGDTRATFFKLALLSHTPPEVRAMVSALEDRIADLECRTASTLTSLELPGRANLDRLDLPEPAHVAPTEKHRHGP